MLSNSSNSSIFAGLTPVGVVAVATAGFASTIWGVAGLAATVIAAAVTVLIYLLSEAFLKALGLVRPLERLMGGMLVRGGAAATVVATAVLALNIEPKLVATLAMAFYGSLIAGEVLAAKRLESAAAAAAQTAVAQTTAGQMTAGTAGGIN